MTDEQIAQQLGVSRFQITVARREAGIPDSRERLRPVLMEAIRRLLEGDGRMSDRELTVRLQGQGFDVSRFTVGHLRKELASSAGAVPREEPVRPQGGRRASPLGTKKQAAKTGGEAAAALGRHGNAAHAKQKGAAQPDPFAHIIGSQGSLRPHIQQAKAAVLYPPHGLHTLLLGPSGVGKNQLAEAMYQFAAVVRGESGPFVAFNCADYAENPQLLLSQLFGHVRGAFTGADTAKAGLVEMADGGFLFLDEVHRLPAEGQEILFQLMDRGVYRRLGETGTERRAAVTLIAATTESPESALLMTFRRRIPMAIELPPLAERPLSERLELVCHFFRQEAARTRTTMVVRSDALRAFLLYDCPGNVGQLKSHVQVASARGFLVHVTEETPGVVVGLPELPAYVRRGLLKLPHRRMELDRRIAGDMIFQPSADVPVQEQEDVSSGPGEIYQFIEQRFAELKQADLSDGEVNRILGAELDRQFRQHIRQVETRPQEISQDELVRIVGPEIVAAVEAMLERVQDALPSPDRHLYYCLAMHVSAAAERLRWGKSIVYPRLEDVKREYPYEFQLALKMCGALQERLGLSIPEDEAGFIAMYLRGSLRGQEQSGEGRVGVVVLTHGEVAGGMVAVATRLMGPHHARWVEMAMDESPESALGRVIREVREADEGRGVLLLADMGSLLTFGEIITERTGIPIRTVPRVDTCMVLEAIRRTSQTGATLDDVADALDGTANRRKALPPKPAAPARKTIVTLCLTGEGTARRLKALLEKLLGEEPVEVVTLGAAEDVDIAERLRQMSYERNLVAVVGTVDPGFPSIPFIPVEDVIGGSGADVVRRVLEGANGQSVDDLLADDLLFPQVRWTSRDEALEACTRALLAGGYVSQAFLTDVYRRELAGATALEGGVAIPHGSSQYVQRPALVIATLAEPVAWGDQPVGMVCMMALGTMGKETFQQIYRALRPGPLHDQIRRAASKEELKRAFLAAVTELPPHLPARR